MRADCGITIIVGFDHDHRVPDSRYLCRLRERLLEYEREDLGDECDRYDRVRVALARDECGWGRYARTR